MNFYLITDNPIAEDSPDHIEPRATARDNSKNKKFNKKLYQLMPPDMSVLDLGCAGGGFVKSLIDDGYIAVGLEGSDYSLNEQRTEWATIPEYLFTCDVTKPFTLYTADHLPFSFHVVTGWEFFEHIAEDRLPMLLLNIRKHLRPYGLVIGSISDFKSVWDVIDHHQTQKPLKWWVDLFETYGFKRREDLESHFGKDWVRSVRYNVVFQEAGEPLEGALDELSAERVMVET